MEMSKNYYNYNLGKKSKNKWLIDNKDNWERQRTSLVSCNEVFLSFSGCTEKAEIGHGLLLKGQIQRLFCYATLKALVVLEKNLYSLELSIPLSLQMCKTGAPRCVKALSFAKKQHALNLAFVATRLRIFRVS